MTKIINTVPSVPTMLSQKAFGPLAEFLIEMDIKISGDRYRDAKTGRMVAASTVMDLFAKWGRNKKAEFEVTHGAELEMDYQDSPTGIVVVEEEDGNIPALLRPSVDYGTMTLEQMLLVTCYARKEASREGIVTKILLRDDEGNLIPIRKVDGEPEMGRVQWASDSPSEVALNRAAKAEAMLLEWGYDTDKFRKDLEVICSLQSVGEKSPFTSAEDVLEAVESREQERLEAKSREFRVWLVKVFGKETATKIWRGVKSALLSLVEELAEEDFDSRCRALSIFSWGGAYEEGRWTKINGPYSWGLVEKNLDAGSYVAQGTKKKFNDFFRLWFWAEIRKEMSPALKGTLLRWLGSEAQLALLEALAEDGHVDRQIVGEKTPESERFRKGPEDWAWSSRVENVDSVWFHEVESVDGKSAAKIKAYQLTSKEVASLLVPGLKVDQLVKPE